MKKRKNNLRTIKLLVIALFIAGPLNMFAEDPNIVPEVEETITETDDGLEINITLEGSTFEVVESDIVVEDEMAIAPFSVENFAAPSGGPHVGHFSNLTGASTVDVYNQSSGGSAITYLTNNSSSGVFPILDEAGSRYKIAVSGVVGWVNKNLVNLTKFSSAKSYDYYRKNSDNELIHYVSSGAHQTGVSAINQGKSPSYINNNTNYLSYDGHYFYPATSDGLNNLIKDYNANTRKTSINPAQPFYNYFQWLPARTQTKLNSNDLRRYLTSKGYNTTAKSRMYETEQLFLDIGNYYGGNAALGFATGIHESGFGRSKFAKERNNYFGHNAYDSSPGSASSYASPADGIGIHFGRFYNWNYINPSPAAYSRGAAVGNKNVGMNVKYASDAYWGEKIAAHYYNMDKLAGFKDYNRYTIALLDKGANVRKDPSKSSTAVAYSTKLDGMPVAILGSRNGLAYQGSTKWYAFSSDAMLDSSGKAYPPIGGVSMYDRYDYSSSTVHIHEAFVTIVNTGKDSTLLPQANTKLPVTPKFESKTTKVYTLNNVHLRPDWSTNYQEILTVPKDVALTGYITENGWIQVTYGGNIGYLSTDYVSLTQGGKPIGGGTTPEEPSKPDPLPQPGSKTMITTANLNMRNHPVSGSVVITVPQGSKVITGTPLNGWVHAKYGAYSGYMSVDYLKEEETKPPVTPPSSRKLGDINNDGVIDSIDMAMMQSHVRNRTKLTGENFRVSDLNKDGKIDSVDMAIIQSHVRGRMKIEGW